ncbi:MAG: transporter substrate-binding protein [Frankiales bacterium]|nr:transporter substrate-binding protein [Frankiales bacterium]
MKTTRAGIKLIIFMVVTSLMTLTLAATIGNFGVGKSTTYHAQFSDVTGLLPGNEVRVAGVKVGKVAKIGLKGNLADVVLKLDGGRQITTSNILQLRYRNLVGERYVAIVEGTGPADPLKAGSTVPLAQTRNALDLTVLFNGFRPLFTALDPKTVNDVSFEIIQTLQGEGGTIDTLLARTASLTTTLANKDAVIGRVVDNLTTVLDTVDKHDTDLNALITQLRRLAEGFAQDRTTIGQSIVGIGNLTDATAGLLNGIRPGVRTDVAQLRTLAHNLDGSKDVINGVLQRLPDKLNRIIATATYGSWFNFYMCGVEINGVQLVNSAPRCQK